MTRAPQPEQPPGTAGPAEVARVALRAALRDALRTRDRVAAAALRDGLSAIDQAEAVPMAGHVPSFGAAAGDVPRRELTRAEVHEAITAEVEERRRSVAELRDVGRDEVADRVAHEIDVLLPHLSA